MTNEQNWAICATMFDIIKHDQATDHKMPDPRLTLEAISKNHLSSCSPSESYSREIPALSREFSDGEYLPIDALFGNYNHRTRRILIYYRSIEKYRSAFEGSFEDILHIVRLHEFAHALVHLGIRVIYRDQVLYDLNAIDRTNWRKFLRTRSDAFTGTDSGSHEFIAQGLTYAGILALPEVERNRLIDVFHRIELRQPDEYKLSNRVKSLIKNARWEIVLDAARGDVNAYHDPGFNLRTGLEEIICFTGAKRPTVNNLACEWKVIVDHRLSDSLRSTLQASDTFSSKDDKNIEFSVDRFSGLKVEIFAREHPPPHFRVICGDETANYRIDDCSQINGGLHRYHRQVKRWHEDNRGKLIEAWNRHRPSDCPVGAFHES